MFARFSAFVIWSLVAGTAVFWTLRLSASPLAIPTYAVATGKPVAMRGDLARLFGAAPVVVARADAVEAPSRFRLVGVMAPKRSDASRDEYGLALIAVDGKPAKPYSVGSYVDPDLVLRSVSMRSASIDSVSGAKGVVLELPALPAPATGTLPSAPTLAPNGVATRGGSPAMPVPAANVPTQFPVSPQMSPPQGSVPTQGAAGLPTPDSSRAQ